MDGKIPNFTECMALLARYECPPAVIKHSLKVNEIALKKNYQLISPFDAKIITCASLLHDICRPQPDHAKEGARLLRRLGYSYIAYIVKAHHDLNDDNFDERHLIYLADKLVKGETEVTIEERFLAKWESFSDPEAKAACWRRYQQAIRIKELYQRKCGK